MQTRLLIEILDRNARNFASLVRDLAPEQAAWKPAPEKWSLLEIVNHLVDEEREDFRQRLDLLLHQPETAWPAIDPPSWVMERKYAQRELQESLNRFLSEREQSVAWLRGLDDPAWNNAHDHPLLGKLEAGDLLAAWVSHDFLHMRQISQWYLQFVSDLSRPYSARYAGG